MTEIITGGFAVLYLLFALVLALSLDRFPDQARWYGVAFIGLLVIAGILQGISALGEGAIEIGAGTLDVPDVVDGAIAYGLLFGVAAHIGGVRGQKLGIAVALPVVMNLSFQLQGIVEGAVGLAGVGFVLIGYPILVWLFFRTFMPAVRQQSTHQQRLYRKFRNLLLFLIGMLILAAVTTLDVLNEDVAGFVVSYVDFLLRVGFAAFLVMNASVLADS